MTTSTFSDTNLLIDWCSSGHCCALCMVSGLVMLVIVLGEWGSINVICLYRQVCGFTFTNQQLVDLSPARAT